MGGVKFGYPLACCNTYNEETIKMKKLLIYIVITLFIATGCATTNTSDISKKWGKLTTLNQRAKSLEVAKRELAKISNPDVYLFLSKSDIDKNLMPILNKKLAKIEVKKTKHVNIKNVKTKFVSQGIRIFANFDIQLEDPDYTFKGSIDGIVATGFRDNNLVLLPAFSSINLVDVDKSKIKIRWKDILKPKILWGKLKLRYGNRVANSLAQVVLKNFMTTINGVAFKEPVEWPVNLNSIGSFSASDILKHSKKKNTEDSLAASDNVITPDLNIKAAAFNINNKGFGLLASFVNESNGVDSVAMLTAGDLEQNISEAEFNSRYKIFNTKFTAKRQLLTKNQAKHSEVMVNKAFVARTFNHLTAQLGNAIGVNVSSLPNYSSAFSEHPKLYKKTHVRCGSLAKNCEAKRKSCAGNCGRFGSHKCRSCRGIHNPFKRAKCVSERESCKLGQTAKKAECKIKAETCRAGQDLEVKNCKVNNTVKIGACKTKLEGARMLEDFLDIGEIKGTVKVSNIHVTSVIKTVKLGADLADVSVNSDLKASARIGVNVDLNPEGVGHIACLWKSKPSVNTTVKIDQDDVNLFGKISHESRGNDGLMLKMKVSSDPFTGHAEPSPWKELTRNKSFQLSCAVADFALNAASMADLIGVARMPAPVKALVTGSYTYKDLDVELEYLVKPISIDASGNKLQFIPWWNKTAIGFRKK